MPATEEAGFGSGVIIAGCNDFLLDGWSVLVLMRLWESLEDADACS